MGPIQVIPPGLTGLLQLKQFGKVPGELADVVAPVLELRDWYLTARRLDQVALFGGTPTRSIAAAGFAALQLAGVNAQVPQGQIWYVEQYGLNGTTALAGDVLSFAPGVTNAALTSFFQTGPTDYDVVTARVRQRVCKSDRGFWAFPGDIFVVWAEDISTAGITVNMNLRATPCPI